MINDLLRLQELRWLGCSKLYMRLNYINVIIILKDDDIIITIIDA